MRARWSLLREAAFSSRGPSVDHERSLFENQRPWTGPWAGAETWGALLDRRSDEVGGGLVIAAKYVGVDPKGD